MASCRNCEPECDHSERCDDCDKCLNCGAPAAPTIPGNYPLSSEWLKRLPFGEYERYEISRTNIPNQVYVH